MCLLSCDRYNMMEESDWVVVIDTVSASDPSQGKRYNTLQIHPHPKFSEDTNDYDLCLLRTQSDMMMGGTEHEFHSLTLLNHSSFHRAKQF